MLYFLIKICCLLICMIDQFLNQSNKEYFNVQYKTFIWCIVLLHSNLVLGLTSKLAVCYQFGTIFVYYSELFTTRVRGVVLVTMVVMSRFYRSICSYIILLANDLHIHPCVFGLIGVLIALPSSVSLPETKHIGMLN